MAMYKATNIIDQAFDEQDIHHNIEQRGNSESVCAGFAIEKGPLVTVRFISTDDGNDVAVRILSLFNDIPKADWPRALSAINRVNCEMRYVKLCLDDDGDINAEFDVPVRCSDDCLGRVACEMFYRVMQIVRSKYELIVRALFEIDDEDDEAPDVGSFEEFMRRYQAERDEDDEDEDGDEDDEDDEDDTDDEDDEDNDKDDDEDDSDDEDDQE